MMKIGNHLTPYLLLICIALAGVLYTQTTTIPPETPTTKPSTDEKQQPRRNETQARNDFNAPSLMSFQEITRRPLFMNDRKPPPPPQRKAVTQRRQVSMMPLNLILEGIVVTTTEQAAMLVNIANSEVLHLGIGMKHQGWELVSITPLTVTFQQGEQIQKLTLEENP